MNIIPCEICNSQVQFENYIQHLEICTMRHMQRMQNPQYRRHYQNQENAENNLSHNNQQSASIGVHIFPTTSTASDMLIRQRMSLNNSTIQQLNDTNTTHSSNSNNSINIDLGRIFHDILSLTSSSNNQLQMISFDSENEFEMNTLIEELAGGNVPVRVNDVSRSYNIIEWTQNNEVIIDSNVSNDSVDDTITCRICFDERKQSDNNNNKVYVKTICNHIYCKECIDKWFNMNHKCPTCMYDFNETS